MSCSWWPRALTRSCTARMEHGQHARAMWRAPTRRPRCSMLPAKVVTGSEGHQHEGCVQTTHGADTSRAPAWPTGTIPLSTPIGHHGDRGGAGPHHGQVRADPSPRRSPPRQSARRAGAYLLCQMVMCFEVVVFAGVLPQDARLVGFCDEVERRRRTGSGGCGELVGAGVDARAGRARVVRPGRCRARRPGSLPTGADGNYRPDDPRARTRPRPSDPASNDE